MDKETLIKALRCSGNPRKENTDCSKYPYRLLEEVKPELPVPTDIVIDGIEYWESCDCDRICNDSADFLESLGD